MIVKSVSVRNFRSILNETIELDNLTALVGANGAGKSTFLSALDIFYSSTYQIELQDFYNDDPSNDIVIAVTFEIVSEEAKDLFSKYIEDSFLTVEAVISWNDQKPSIKLHGSTMQNEDCVKVRHAGNASERKKIYEQMRQTKMFSSLPAWQNQNQGLEALREWEENNPDYCTRQRDDGSFFGFKQVAQGYLGRFSKFLFIHAVRDASEDAAEGRGTPLSELMDLVVRSVIVNKKEFQALRKETQDKYIELMDPSKIKELPELAKSLTKTLKTFVPDASVHLEWSPIGEIELPMPRANVRLVEDGYPTSVNRSGHGLQRAYILTMLQHLAYAQTTDEISESDETENEAQDLPLPNLLLAIEEPELYQHPSRQRHLADILLKIGEGSIPGVAAKTQVIYGTHSPLFVGIDRIEQIRLLRKEADGKNKPKVTKCVSINLDLIAEIIWKAAGEPGAKWTAGTLKPRLGSIMTPWMSEGFFADVAVLVEGEDDRAAILGVARVKDLNLESMGISVIPCGGKTNLDRPAAIFRELGIPIYVIWDSDKDVKDANTDDNHRLLRLMDAKVEDWPVGVNDHFACFEVNLETTLRSEIGSEKFNALLEKCKKDYNIPKNKHALKNPYVYATIVETAQSQGLEIRTCSKIVDRIVSLKN